MATTIIKGSPITEYSVPSSAYGSFVTPQGSGVKIYKQGKIVSIVFLGTVHVDATQTGWAIIFTIPSEYRPPATVKASLLDDHSYSAGFAKSVEVSITDEGKFRVFAPQKDMSLWGGTIMYFAN